MYKQVSWKSKLRRFVPNMMIIKLTIEQTWPRIYLERSEEVKVSLDSKAAEPLLGKGRCSLHLMPGLLSRYVFDMYDVLRRTAVEQ